MFPQASNPNVSHSKPDFAHGRLIRFRPSLEILEERNMTGLVVVPAGNNPLALAQALVGTGVQIMNVTSQLNTPTAGFFTGGTGIIGFESGIILSTGNAADVIGPNKQVSTGADTSVDNGLGSDHDLAQLIGVADNQTHNASTLSFDFIPQGSTLTFNYVFASEEYNNFVGTQFNDVIGLFVNGQNVALVPGTSTPVSVNNVNMGMNSAFFRNNDILQPNNPIDTEMNGLTTVLTATAQVNPGVLNHIKLGVADTGDTAFDSNVFIQAGSFSASAPPPLQPFYPFRYIQDQQTGLFHGNLSLLNTSSASANFGPIEVIFPQLPSGVTLVNADGTTDSGAPFLLIPAGTVISPGNVFRLELVFSDPANTPISTFFIGPPVQFAVPTTTTMV
jgi:hypothetical protein